MTKRTATAALLAAQTRYAEAVQNLEEIRAAALCQVEAEKGPRPGRGDRVRRQAWVMAHEVAKGELGEFEAWTAKSLAADELLGAFHAMMTVFADTPARQATWAPMAEGWDNLVSGAQRQNIIDLAAAA